MAKKYSKKGWGSLLQVRMSKEEKKSLTEFINKFGVTQRDFLLAVQNDLREAKVLRDGYFYTSESSYAQTLSDKWDKTINENSVCEACGERYKVEYNMHNLCRHHHNGYDEENILKVHIVCKVCHGKLHHGKYKEVNFEEAKQLLNLEELKD